MYVEKVKRMAKSGFIPITVGNFSYAISSFAVSVLIARILGSTEFGIYALGVAVSGLIWRFFIVGPTSILGREIPRIAEGGLSLFQKFILFEVLLIPVGVLLGFMYSLFAGYPERVIVLMILISIAKAFEYLQDNIRYYLLGNLNETAFGMTLILRAVALFVSVSIPLYFGLDLAKIVLCQLGLSAMLFCVLYYRFTPTFSFSFDWQRMKWIGYEALPLSLSGFLWLFQNRIDVLMLSAMAGVREVGLYSAALAIPQGLAIIPMGLASQMFPRVSALYTKSKSDCYKLIKAFTSRALLLGVFASLILLAMANMIMTILYGKGYREAGPVLVILGFGFIFGFANCITGTALTATNMQRHGLLVVAIAAACNLVGSYLLIPRLGYVGSAISTSFSSFVLLLLSSIIIHSALVSKNKSERVIAENVEGTGE